MAQEDVEPKEQQAQQQYPQGQALAELVQAGLQGRLPLRGVLQQGGDLPHLRVHPRGGDQEAAPSVGDKAAGKHHVGPLPQGDVAGEGVRVLLHRQALPGEGALGGFQAGGFQQPPVGAHRVPGLQEHDVPRDHLPARELHHLPVPEDFGSGGGEGL